MNTVPYSASELAHIAATGNGQDVVDAVKTMNATHGEFLTGLMMRSALNTVDAEAGAPWIWEYAHLDGSDLITVMAKKDDLAELKLQQPAPTVAELHARFAHPSYEYATTQGPRKSWDGYDDPPEGDGWERNVDAGRDGWERFDYHEESYWRRLRPDATCDFPSCVHPDHQAASDLNGGDEQ